MRTPLCVLLRALHFTQCAYFLNSRLIFQTTATFSSCPTIITSQCRARYRNDCSIIESERAAGFFFEFIYPSEGKYLLSHSVPLPKFCQTEEVPGEKEGRGIIYLVKGSRNKKSWIYRVEQ